MGVRAFISGCEGTELSPSETRFFSDSNPLGLILFRRNCETRDQLRSLVTAFRESVGRADAFVMIDQEGGRVARLMPPEWQPLPPAGVLGRLYESDPDTARLATRLHSRLLAHDLQEVGITANCLPVLDIPSADAHGVIGDRAYGTRLETVEELGRITAATHLDNGVVPVLKHMPGHGRAGLDSHEALPVVATDAAELRAVDFVAFRALSDFPAAMTAHVVYAAIDPEAPATLSRTVISDVIRGYIGFEGLLLTDDIAMGAVSGGMAERATTAIKAGCDVVLHCNGDMGEMEEIAAGVPELEGASRARADRMLAQIRNPIPKPFDAHAAWSKLKAILESAGYS